MRSAHFIDDGQSVAIPNTNHSGHIGNVEVNAHTQWFVTEVINGRHYMLCPIKPVVHLAGI